MFSLDVVDTDIFLDMPASTQSLYFHLGMRADDDGFVSSPRKITNMVNCSNDDLKLLIAKGYVIAFESGILVIREWKVNNYIQKDRYKATKYIHEKNRIEVGIDGSYKLLQDVSEMDSRCIQNISEVETQVNIGKVSKGKDSTDNQLTAKKVRELANYYSNCFRRIIPPVHLDKLKTYLDYGMEIELIEYIMEYSADKKEPWKYCCKVIENSAINMVTTLGDFKSNLKVKEQKRGDEAYENAINEENNDPFYIPRKEGGKQGDPFHS